MSRKRIICILTTFCILISLTGCYRIPGKIWKNPNLEGIYPFIDVMLGDAFIEDWHENNVITRACWHKLRLSEYHSAVYPELAQTFDKLNADSLTEAKAQMYEFTPIEIVVFGVSSVNASEEDEKMIKEIQRNAALRNPTMAAAHLVGAQAQAMQDAAKNEGGIGAMGGFFGMNMAQNAGVGAAANLFAMGQQQPQQPVPQAPVSANTWICECGTENNGKFCPSCGRAKPIPMGTWTCKCGCVNMGKFCSECGSPKP